MRHLFLLLGLGLSASSALYALDQNPVEVDSPVTKIFVPNGFDDNDNVEVIMHGDFTDTCHQVGRAEASVDEATKTVTVSATSYKYPGKFCIQSITPFIQTVSLGLVGEGNYKVVYKMDKAVKGDLNVAKRKTESPDDYLYATVENAYIDVNFETGKQALKLQGHFPYFFVGCMVMKEVRVSKDPTDVLVVQPLAEIVNTDVCDSQPADRSFEYTSGLPSSFQGEGLLHVRTLNGSSLNRFINIQ
ncbi:MAG: hypothetical protein NTX25_02395 [Proteobacteria bacterium]|nr:hypothetical protein [Pseudomonadota bacterium]